MLPLLALNPGSWKRISLCAGVVILVGLIGATAKEFFELRKARLAYEKPRVIHVEVKAKTQGPTTKKEGPSRKETKTVRRPDGTEEILVTETRGPTEEIIGSTTEWSKGWNISEPVFMPAPRPPRWLLGLSLADLRASDRTAYTLWPGVTLGDRLVLEAGLDGDFSTKRLKASWRF